MRLSTLPICAILASAYPLTISRKDDEEVPPGEERRGEKEITPPTKPDQMVIEMHYQNSFFGQKWWTTKDRGSKAFYTRLYHQNGARKRKPKRR